jgi:hypothetical protein
MAKLTAANALLSEKFSAVHALPEKVLVAFCWHTSSNV